MLDNLDLSKTLFVDIETVPQYYSFSELPEQKKEIFKKRFKKDIYAEIDRKISANNTIEKLKKELEIDKDSTKKKQKVLTPEEFLKKIENEVTSEIYDIKASLFAEWNKIIVISVGILWKKEGEDFYNIKTISFSSENEKELLSDFINHEKLGAILNKAGNKSNRDNGTLWSLCAYNGETFDYQVIAKRLLINGFKLPAMFNYSQLKPWEIFHLVDPKKLWSYGVWDSSTSLQNLCDIFEVPSPKDDISGEDVKDVFYKEKNLQRIAKYCEKDVISLARVVFALIGIQEEIRVYFPTVQVIEEI